MNKYFLKLFSNKLGLRVLLYIVLLSLFISILASLTQLYGGYSSKLDNLKQEFASIELGYKSSLANNLWNFNDDIIMLQLQGIVSLPNICFAKISTKLKKSYQIGDENIVSKSSVIIPLVFNDVEVGQLEVIADHQDIYESLKQRAGVIILVQSLEIFFISFSIMLIVHLSITRHIFRISNFAKNMSSHNLNEALYLLNRSNNKDELDLLVDSINAARVNLYQDINKRKIVESQLLELSDKLEKKVYERTEELEKSLEHLTLAKDKLVQSEKMASLGQLVAGVAHEVNTPLGISITAISAMSDEITDIKKSLKLKQLTQKQLISSLDILNKYQKIVETSVTRAANLISSFKAVSVIQNIDNFININLDEHVHNIVNTVQTIFKRENYKISINIDKDINLFTDPSAWHQILTNFLMNSHHHGFEGTQEGNINIDAYLKNNNLIFHYSDNGKGIAEEVKDKIFDPFVTTKLGKGGSGLGLNIVYNIIDVKLHGNIDYIDCEIGCCFEVKIPLCAPKS